MNDTTARDAYFSRFKINPTGEASNWNSFSVDDAITGSFARDVREWSRRNGSLSGLDAEVRALWIKRRLDALAGEVAQAFCGPTPPAYMDAQVTLGLDDPSLECAPDETSLPSDGSPPGPFSDGHIASIRARAAAAFNKRVRTGVSKPSETIQMAMYPFEQPAVTHSAHNPNCQLAASREQLMDSPDIPICTPPTTGPALTGEGIDDWCRRMHAELAATKETHAALVSQAYKAGLPTPEELFANPADWALICAWCTAYRAEMARAETLPNHRFRYDALPFNGKSPKDGVRFPISAIRSQYRPLVWSLQELDSNGGRCTPIPWRDPQDDSEWDLQAIWEDTVALWKQGVRFEDMEILFELCFKGISMRSVAVEAIALIPNYKSYWAEGSQGRTQAEAFLNNFEPARASQPSELIPCIPGICLPRGMHKQFNEDGSVKAPRCTVNPNDSHPHGDPDYSINGCTDLLDESRFPLVNGEKMRFLRIPDLAKQAAIIMASGASMGQRKDDLTSYYPQLPRPGSEQHQQLQWLMSEGPQIARRMLFGIRAECATSNRVAFLLVFHVRHIFAQRQNMRERDGSIPADLLEWIKHRRELGQSGALAVFGQFFDDLISSYAEIMGDDVHECEQAVWSKYNIDVADGHIHPVTGVACKDKSERVDEHGEMTSLGLMIDFQGLGRISYGSLKKFKYTRKGSAITSAARSAHPGRDSFRIDRQGFHSWAGQLGFLGQVDINAYGLLNQLRAHLPPGWERRQHFQVSAAAVSLMEDITSEIHNDRGMALFPDMSPPGTLRQAIWTFTDAARRPDAHHDDFVGFGGWFWNPAAPTEIPYFLGEWTHHEQRMLPSTELELHTKNMAAQLADRTGWFSSSRASLGAITSDIAVDLIQAGDNSSASGIAGSANSGHASSHAVRALLRNRSLWLQSQNIRTFSTHLVREYNVPADHLSNGKKEDFKTSLSAFFGADLRFKDITGSIPPEFRSLEPALLASKQAAAAAKMMSKHHRKNGDTRSHSQSATRPGQQQRRYGH
jgi:hypothetical protein